MIWWIFPLTLIVIALVFLTLVSIKKAERMRYSGRVLMPKNLWEKIIINLFLKDRLK